MDAQQAKARILTALREVMADGFALYGHWDDSNLVLIQREVPRLDDVEAWQSQQYSDENHAAVTIHDLEGT